MPRNSSGRAWHRHETQSRMAHRLQCMHRPHVPSHGPSLRQTLLRLVRYSQCTRPLRGCAVLWLLCFLSLKTQRIKHHVQYPACPFPTFTRVRRTFRYARPPLALCHLSTRRRFSRHWSLFFRHRSLPRLPRVARSFQSVLIPRESLSETVASGGESIPIPESNQIP